MAQGDSEAEDQPDLTGETLRLKTSSGTMGEDTEVMRRTFDDMFQQIGLIAHPDPLVSGGEAIPSNTFSSSSTFSPFYPFSFSPFFYSPFSFSPFSSF
ncbi:unnamed protein product [Boreogadus saida]